MTLFVFPYPLEGVEGLLTAAKLERWPTATLSVKFPQTDIAVPHIQYAWDGTPSQQVNRQVTVIRITVWTPKGQVSEGVHLAQLVLAYLLDSGSGAIWRFRPGAGPTRDVDPDTKLPFCTFTLNAETRPVAVS